MRRNSRAALIVAVVAAVAAASAWYRSSRTPNLRAALAQSVGATLPFEARLSGGFAPPEPTSLRRSSDTVTVALPPDARIAIAQLEKRAATYVTPEALADLGVAYLVQGDVDRSIALLRDSAAQGPHSAAWSDLAAAYLVKAERLPARRIEYLSRALDAAAQSLKMATSNEARFNRALALERMAPYLGEPAPWTEYASTETDVGWREAATRHASASRPINDASARWTARLTDLRMRLATGDSAFVAETARLFPEASLELFDQQLLAWARALLAGDRAGARSIAGHAQLLASSIESATGDRLPAEEVALLPSATALAEAHLAYADGVRKLNAGDYSGAEQLLRRARSGFAAAKSAYDLWSRAQLAVIAYQRRDLAAADLNLATVAEAASQRRYRTLLGRALWVRGLVHAKAWRLTEALAAFERAATTFEGAGEREFAVNIYSLLADTYRSLGEQQQSWGNIGRTLDGLSSLRNPVRRYLVLYNAMLFALRDDLLEVALAFQNATVREASRAGNEGVLVDALTQRADVHLRRGDRLNAARDLDAAFARIGRVTDPSLRQYHNADIEIVRAQLGAPTPAAALANLRRSIGYFERAEPARVPGLFLRLARIAGQADTAEAERALSEGIERLEQQQVRLGDEALKVSYFDDSWELFEDMVALQLATRFAPERAFEYAERSRARVLLAATDSGEQRAIARLTDVQKTLPPGVVLLYSATLPDRVVLWTVTATTIQMRESRVASAELGRLVLQYRSALLDGRSNQLARTNARLHEILLRPVIDTLADRSTVVVAADGILQQLPFAALRNTETGRYFVEDHTVLMTPSASFFATRRSDGTRVDRGQVKSALLIGDPAGAGVALPAAAGEAVDAARFYEDHQILVGAAATKAAFVETAPHSDVVHFAGHGIVNLEYPMLSRLVFAAGPDGGEQALFAHEISRMRFNRTRVVILAACSTAGGVVSRGEGVISVARPFLAAGVPLVIASQWDVDDRATRELFLEFHQAFAAYPDSVQALRHAQLALLRSNNASLSSPGVWGAFVALGTLTN